MGKFNFSVRSRTNKDNIETVAIFIIRLFESEEESLEASKTISKDTQRHKDRMPQDKMPQEHKDKDKLQKKKRKKKSPVAIFIVGVRGGVTGGLPSPPSTSICQALAELSAHPGKGRDVDKISPIRSYCLCCCLLSTILHGLTFFESYFILVVFIVLVIFFV